MPRGRRKRTAVENFLFNEANKEDLNFIENKINVNEYQLKIWQLRYVEQMSLEAIAEYISTDKTFVEARTVSKVMKRLNKQAERILLEKGIL